MNTLALQKTPLRQVTDVRSLLMNEQARTQLEAVAAKHMNPERMMRVVANAIRTTPKLQQCDPMSFLGALMQCAALGLEPNTILGHAYMIPFDRNKKIKSKNDQGREVEQWVKVAEVQLVIGYKGLIDLARRSGHITSLSANIHYADDELWEYEEGTEAKLRHRPGPLEGDKKHAYAIAKFKDGGHAYVVLPWSHIIKIRDASQGYQTAKKAGKLAETPWVKHEDEMAKKTAIRALAKYLPLSVEFMGAMEIDETKADYRAFAMDPVAGVQIEEDQGETIDGEAAEATVTQEVAAPKRSRHDIQKEHRQQTAAKAPPVARREDAQANTSAPVDGVATNTSEIVHTESQTEATQTNTDDAAQVDGGAVDAVEPTAEGDAPGGINLMDFATAKTIIDDAMDLGADAARGVHANVIAILKQQQPEIYAALDAELDRIGG